MQEVQQTTDLPWLPQNTQLTLYKTTELPALELITSVHVFCFIEGKALFVRHETRDWDIPGGHIDPGETPEQALKREAQEEASARIHEPRLFAVNEISITEPYPEGYQYPMPKSYQLFYICDSCELEEFSAEFETSERTLVDPFESSKIDWVRRNSALWKLALAEK